MFRSHERFTDEKTFRSCCRHHVHIRTRTYDHLTKQGYRVHRDIGCSAYKIDLAVTDPNDETRYVLGIECDGPSYARQATARDRDQTRQSVLKGLGWNMFRLWSVEWAFDRDKAEKELDDAVKSALSKWK